MDKPTPSRRWCRRTASYKPGGYAERLELPWRMNDGVKEFHLVAEPVVANRPGMKAHLWATTARAGTHHRVGGRTACAFRHQTACRSTPASIARQRLPNGMDGVNG